MNVNYLVSSQFSLGHLDMESRPEDRELGSVFRRYIRHMVFTLYFKSGREVGGVSNIKYFIEVLLNLLISRSTVTLAVSSSDLVQSHLSFNWRMPSWTPANYNASSAQKSPRFHLYLFYSFSLIPVLWYNSLWLAGLWRAWKRNTVMLD